MGDFQFRRNATYAYADNEYVEKNTFIERNAETGILPKFDDIKDLLPVPVFEGHEDEIKAYYAAWKIAFSNLRPAVPCTNIISDFIDTAFNGYSFMWDSVFMAFFGRYASEIFPFQKTLDNFYASQHKDGFISRQINCETGYEKFEHHDPISTGPNILAWCEWEYYQITGDKSRISEVYYPLLAYHKWLKLNRTWRDGSYWSSGLGSGMDNQPRQPEGYSYMFSHGHMVWLDTTLQQILNAKTLIKMASLLKITDGTEELEEEIKILTDIVNNQLWDEKEQYYFDLWRDGRLNGVKSVGAYWALLADVVPRENLDRFTEHLKNENEFNRPHRIPSLSYDHPLYDPKGDYWRGSVWPSTDYMVLKGLDKEGYNDLAYEIALNTVENVAKIYKQDGTFYENYAPEVITKGSLSKDEFVGWTGVIPIAVFIEYVIGIRAKATERKLVWHIHRTERHGIKGYPFLKGHLNLICEKRSAGEKPKVFVSGDVECTVEIICNENRFIIKNI